MQKKSKPSKKKLVEKKTSNKFITKKTLVGRYQLGWRMVNLYINPQATGASFNICLNEQDAFIIVGYDPQYYQSFVWLCHEVFEMAADDEKCVFRPKAFEDGASDVVHIFMNHNQYTEVAAKSGYFIAKCQNDFNKAHSKVRI